MKYELMVILSSNVPLGLTLLTQNTT